MEDSNAKRFGKRLARWVKRRSETVSHLREWTRHQGRDVPGEFLQGGAYKLGSGAATLIIVWWETRH
ncbi:hypothetical protein [Streptomyces longisporus]|uniref:Uncharacterized protein n=1 Tax=Streptomyces longisporus TaxID=1948 RepID=A0ABP5YSX0_STRLO